MIGIQNWAVRKRLLHESGITLKKSGDISHDAKAVAHEEVHRLLLKKLERISSE